ncbi:MAG: purine-nucleoside phosphorylase [Bradymonadia bacterium]|jgi:purine-nucleoside phosphorylase
MVDFEASVEAADFIRSRADRAPTIALILGSGLGAYADELEQAVKIPYSEIPNFHASTVSGHAGQLVLGRKFGLNIVAMQGRVHAYEGLGMKQVVFPLRTMWQLGARTLIVTNAAGGVNPDFKPADLMCINDHLNLTGGSPLTGPNDDRFGPRFPDMTHAYTPSLQTVAHATAAELGFTLHDGVYAGMLGPAYETPSEVRMVRALGGDAVGMSTVPEVLVASHMKMRVLGISCITNAAAGITGEALDHSEVTDVAKMVRERFIALVDGVLGRIGAN